MRRLRPCRLTIERVNGAYLAKSPPKIGTVKRSSLHSLPVNDSTKWWAKIFCSSP